MHESTYVCVCGSFLFLVLLRYWILSKCVQTLEVTPPSLHAHRCAVVVLSLSFFKLSLLVYKRPGVSLCEFAVSLICGTTSTSTAGAPRNLATGLKRLV